MMEFAHIPNHYSASTSGANDPQNVLLRHLSELQFFLATAPSVWQSLNSSSKESQVPSNLNRFQLPNGEHVSCVFWNGLYHITGTDIVRALVFRFEAFARPVKNMKKFEEGVFSDLRNLKPGNDACLEEPKSPFLDLLFRNGCIRTQKKQKVFFWFSVPHDRLFLDALERDLKREKMGLEPTTEVRGEPARSFAYDPKRSLWDQFAGAEPRLEESLMSTSRDIPSHRTGSTEAYPNFALGNIGAQSLRGASASAAILDGDDHSSMHATPALQPATLFSSPFLEGSAAYKKRNRGPGLKRHCSLPLSSLPDLAHAIDGDLNDSSSLGRRLLPVRTTASEQPWPGPLLSHIFPPGLVHGAYGAGDPQILASSPFQEPAEVIRMGDVPAAMSSAPFEGLVMTERSFGCPAQGCLRVFKRLEHLRRHVRSHTQEKPYSCTHCCKAFSRSDYLNQHLKTHDPDSSPSSFAPSWPLPSLSMDGSHASLASSVRRPMIDSWSSNLVFTSENVDDRRHASIGDDSRRDEDQGLRYEWHDRGGSP